MELQPHQQRVVEEKEALQEKVEKLKTFTESETFKTLSKNDQKLLKYQLIHLNSYLYVLEVRVMMFTELELEESKGEEIIGLFGTENDDVMTLKFSAISFIDTIENLVNDPRRKAIAITHVEQAQMMAVKGLFSK